MFTGIVEEIGQIKEFVKLSSGAKISIKCSKVLEGSKIGDSIAINGCCQTITEIGQEYFSADVSEETLRITNFEHYKSGVSVNLERALTPTSRLGGHIVQGHIDCTGNLISCDKISNFYNLTFKIPQEEIKYVVNKGSITVNGISLTVAKVCNNIFSVAVIPHTFEQTNLKNLQINDTVNIETDILGRYIEKFLSLDNNKSTIDETFLAENGFM